MLSSSKTIIVIAPDLGLRQALTFALEVEGFDVEAFAGWSKDSALGSSSLCLVIDDQIVRDRDDARQDLLDADRSVILLTDGISPLREDNPGLALSKPFEGSELLRMVRSFALAAA